MPMPYTMKFMETVWAAFLARVRPTSTIAKPSCMNMTRKPATSVQTKLIEVVLSAAAFATSSSFGGAATGAPCAPSTIGAIKTDSTAAVTSPRRT
jgi:hypothetical protein